MSARADGAGGDTAAPVLVRLRQALPGTFVALARALPAGELEIAQSTRPECPPGLRLAVPGQAQAEAWLDCAGLRLGTGWSLALGERPAQLYHRPLGGTDRVLVAAAAAGPDARVTAVLDLAAQALESGFAAGGRDRLEFRVNARLEGLVDALETPVVLFDSGNADVLLNAAAERLLGLPESGSTPREVAGAMRELLGDALDTRASEDRFACELEREGEVWSVLSQRLDGALLQGRLWQFHDVTRVRRQERALMEGMRADTISRITGGVAHQFNNLLAVIIGNAETLQLELDPDASRERSLVSNLLLAAERGAGLVEQLLAYGARSRNRPEVVEIGAEMRRLAVVFREMLPESYRFTSDIGGESAPVLCDRGLLADAVVNIVVNARESMAEGGEIVLRLGIEHEQRRVLLEVVDEGVGMSDQVLRRARDPFFSTKGLGNARGLGLAVADGFVRGCKGELEIESEPGRGTVVRLALPLARER